MVEDDVCFNSIKEQRIEFAAHSLQMSLANMRNYYKQQMATKSHFQQKVQSRFAFAEGIPLRIVQPFRQTKSTNIYDSFMSISDVHATEDMTKSAF